MKTAKEWVIEEAGDPDVDQSYPTWEGGSFDLLTNYPALLKWVSNIQRDAYRQALHDSIEISRSVQRAATKLQMPYSEKAIMEVTTALCAELNKHPAI